MPGTPTSAWSGRLLLLLSSLVLLAVTVELGLRGVGLMLHRSLDLQATVSGDEEVRVLCLGESTTYTQYPRFLASALESSTGLQGRFEVIDGGIGGGTTTEILARLEERLETHQPHIIVAMMGINDHLFSASTQPYDGSWLQALRLGVENLRLVRLVQRSLGGVGPEGEELRLEPSELDDPLACLDLGTLQRDAGDSDGAMRWYQRAAELAPDDPRPLLAQGDLLISGGRSGAGQAESLYAQALAVDPSSADAHVGLGWAAMNQGHFVDAVAEFQAAQRLEPDHAQALFLEASCYLKANNRGNFFAKQGQAFLEMDQEESCKRAVPLLLRAIGTGRVSEQGFVLAYDCGAEVGFEPGQLEELLRASERFETSTGLPWDLLSSHYQAQGETQQARAYIAKANAQRFAYYNPVTRSNYLALLDMAEERGIAVVAVEYPRRSPEPLRRMLEGRDVTIVDNRETFEQALRQSSYDALFLDRMGGIFGHATDRGNKLLAQNIAEVIAAEVLERPSP